MIKLINESAENILSKEKEINALIKPSIEHSPTPEMIDLQKEIDAIVIPEILNIDVSELKQAKEVVQNEIDSLKEQLTNKKRTEELKARLEELNEQQRTLSQKIATFERLEHQIKTFQNSEMDLIEKRVNDKFALVKFKMFNIQMNGGIEQTCVAMVNGVPYKSVNTAGQIQASLDIINTIQHHYSTFAPGFIDNAESITDIPTMNCQTVQLIVKKGQKNIEVLTLDQ